MRKYTGFLTLTVFNSQPSKSTLPLKKKFHSPDSNKTGILHYIAIHGIRL